MYATICEHAKQESPTIAQGIGGEPPNIEVAREYLEGTS